MARRNVIQFSIEVIDKASKQLGAIATSFGRFTKRMAISAAALSAGLFGAARVAIRAADEIGKMAKVAGISAESLQELRFAAKLSGIETRGLDDSMRRFNRRLGELANSGLGPAEKAFKALGVSIRTASGQVRDTESIFDDIVQSMSEIDNVAQQSALAAQLFGDDFGPKLVTLISKGTASIDEMRQKARDLGIVLSNETIAAAETANDKFTILTEFIRTKMIKAFVDNAEVIGDVAEVLTNAAIKAAEFLTNVAGIFNLTEMAKAKHELKEIRESIAALEKGFEFRKGNRWFGLTLDNLREMEHGMEEFIVNLRNMQSMSAAGASGGGGGSGGIFGFTGDSATANPLQSFIDSFDTIQQRVDKQLAQLRMAIAEGLIPDESEQKRIQFAIESQLIETIEVTAKKIPKVIQEIKPFDPLIAAAEQAARNTQDAFAEFFFDPFEDGLKGLVDAFIRAVRRMIAEALALQTVKLFGFTDIFSKILGRASGGPASGLTMVGERGPELVNLPRGSRVVNNSATNAALRGGEPQFITNIDARGADPGLIARLPQYLEQRDKQLMLAVQRYVTTGTLPI